jgi:hypothetical protein
MNPNGRKNKRAKLIRMRAAERPNCLGEAFRIASGVSPRVPERAHLIAVIAHCRKLVSALMNLPEVE